MSLRKTLDDPQDHAENPSPTKRPKKSKTALFGPPKPSNAIAEEQPATPVQEDENVLELDIGDLLDNFTVSKETRNVNLYKKALDNGLRLKRAVPAFDIPAGPTSTGNAGGDEQPTTMGRDEARSGAETVEKHADQSSSTKVCDWEHAPVYNNRSFEVVSISSKASWHKAKGASGDASVYATFWGIQVHDESIRDAPIFEVYGILPGPSDPTKQPINLQQEVRGGPLITDLFRTEQDVRQLGDIVCRLLDRFPYDLDATRWNKPVGPVTQASKQDWVAERRLVQARAIDLYSPWINRAQLLPYFRKLAPSTTLAEKRKRPQDTGTFIRAIKCLFHDDHPDQVYTDKGQKGGHELSQVTVLVDVNRLDRDKVNALPDVPSSFLYKMSTLPKDVDTDKHDFSDDEEALVLKAFSNIQYKIAFKVATPAALVELARDEYHKLFKSGVNLSKKVRKLRKSDATLEPASAASSKRSTGSVLDLGVTWIPLNVALELRPGTIPRGKVTRPFPYTAVRTTSRILSAYVINRWVSTYVNDKQNCLKSALATAIAADEVSCKQVDESQVKEAYCHCNDTASRNKTMHACMHCFKMFPCEELATTADSRRICEATCAKVPSIMDSSTPLSTAAVKPRISRSVREARRTERDTEGSTTELCTQTAFSSIVDLERGDSGKYKDAYSDCTRINGLSLTDPHNATSRPMFASVDAIHQMVIVGDHVVIHAPTNIVCTTMAMNYMKGTWGVHIVPAMLAAAKQTQKEKLSGTRDPLWWADWYLCIDRLHHLCFLIPYSKQSRLELASTEVNASTLQEFLECLRSSSWHKGQESPIRGWRSRSLSTDGDVVRSTDVDKGFMTPPTWTTRTTATKEKPPKWRAWDTEERIQIQQVIKEIEADPQANPAGLKMPRLAQDAPWPFRQDHIFSDDIDPWSWWHREMLCRYTRMWWLCDILHDTSESTMTLLLEVIVQWFARRGGVDQYIFCEMTPYRRHPLKYSFGRSGNVNPGSPMRTGFTETSPTSFRPHYDKTRSTIVVQPWIINALWSNFDPSEHENIFQLLLSLAPATEHFRAYKRSRASDTPAYPKESSASRRLRLGQPAEAVVYESDEDDYDDESRREDHDGDGDGDEVTALDNIDENADKSCELWLEYGKIRKFVNDYFVDDNAAQPYVDALLAAARKVNSDSFESSLRRLYLYIKAKCCVCERRIIDGPLLRCRNHGHQQALFHKECVPDGLTMLCPPCREEDENLTSVAPTDMAVDSVCEHCSEKFDGEAALSAHIRDAHQAPAQNEGFVAPEDMVIDSVVCEHCSGKFDDEAALNVHVRETHQAPKPVQPVHPEGSSTPAPDSLQQLLLRLEQQQATLFQQQSKMEQQQAKVDEQQSTTANQQRELLQQTAKVDEQQTTIDKKQRELDDKLQQQATLNEQQNQRQAKMDDQQSAIDKQQRELDAKLQQQKEQHKNLVQRELDMLAREDKQLQEWQEMMAKRKEENKVRTDELRASLLG